MSTNTPFKKLLILHRFLGTFKVILKQKFVEFEFMNYN